MIINDLKIMNMDIFYDIIRKKLDNPATNKTMFGRNFSQLLNHVSVVMELSDVTDFEYIFLKMYCTSVTERYLYFGNRISSDSFLRDTYPEIYLEAIKPFLPLVSPELDKFGKERFTRILLPPGMCTSRCVVTISGESLISIFTTLDPTEFFIKATNGKCMKENTDGDNTRVQFKEEYNLDTEEFNNYMISTFLSKFYKFIVDRCEYVDMITDAYNHSSFIDVTYNNVTPTSIVSPFFAIDLIHDDVDQLPDMMSTHRTITTHIYNPKSLIMDSTYFEFSISSMFDVFIRIFEILPYDKFTSIESFKILLNKSMECNIPPCPPQLCGEYSSRYSNRTSALHKSIMTAYGKNTNQYLKLLELIEPYTKIKYVIRLSFSDIDNYIVPFLFSHDNPKDGIIPDMVEDEVAYYLNEIVKFTKNIYSYLI
jgi:hypothetical protein